MKKFMLVGLGARGSRMNLIICLFDFEIFLGNWLFWHRQQNVISPKSFLDPTKSLFNWWFSLTTITWFKKLNFFQEPGHPPSLSVVSRAIHVSSLLFSWSPVFTFTFFFLLSLQKSQLILSHKHGISISRTCIIIFLCLEMAEQYNQYNLWSCKFSSLAYSQNMLLNIFHSM